MSRKTEISAGLLVYRRKPDLEVLLAHPGGPFWAKKDAGVWTIPKGLVESGDLLACARREFTEETGLAVDGPFVRLDAVKQKSGKTVHAFAVQANLDLAGCRSNFFQIEWPPRSGKRKNFPEVDRVAYFDLPTAMVKILAYQQPFLRELAEKVSDLELAPPTR
jgi:predicted NUDIX family NTP pyrophosphohydrolase